MKVFLAPLISFVVLLILAFVCNFTLDSFIQIQIVFVLINIILALSLNLINGITGQFSLGHAGFMAVGAYVAAFGLKNLQLAPGFFNFVAWATLGGCAAAVAGFAVGLPSLRLRGDYLAVVTLGFGEIIRVLALNIDAVGGARGLSDIPAPAPIQFFGFEITTFMFHFLHSGIWCLLTFFVCWRLVESGIGLRFLSVREDELAASACGVNTTRIKVQVFSLASFFAGAAGACLASVVSFINPATFGFSRSVDAIIMVVLGGMGSMSGAILAAIFVTALPELLRPLQEWTGVDLRMVIYSLALIIVMVLRPQGLFGKKELTDLLPIALKKTRKGLNIQIEDQNAKT